MNNISTIVGGMCAQECLKIITKQYIPLNNTAVFDGYYSGVSVYQFK
jgi:amyloid beta precursor protein binding protein 1